MNENDQDMIQEDAEEEIDYAEEIRKLKESTVSKEKYQKLLRDNRNLMESLMKTKADSDEEPEPADLKALKAACVKENTNMGRWKAFIEYRNACIEQGKEDPFCVPKGMKIAPTEEDQKAAQRVADGIEHCLEIAEGDPAIFDQEFYRITIDNVPTKIANRRR